MSNTKKKKKKNKKSMKFPEDGIVVRNRRILITKCCDCGLRHAHYYEVERGKKEEDDMIYIQCERIND